MPETAIVILNWNGKSFLERFLGSVVENSLFPGGKIYVADNGSADDSVKYIRENHPSVAVIELGKNHGFAEGYNLALRQISADYFILLNSDIEVTPGWASDLASFMESHPDAGACQPKILSWGNREKFEYAGAAGGYIDKYGYPFCRGRIFDVTEKDDGQYDTVEEVFWTSGACMIVRSEAWNKCGGLDPAFFAHMEEIDLCWRMRLSGYKLYYDPHPVVYHVGGGSLPYNSSFKTYLNFRNNLYLLYKNLPGKKLHSILLRRKLLDGISALFFLLKGGPGNIKAVWKAHIDYYKSSERLRKSRNEVLRLSEENASRLILNKSIVFEFYIKGKKDFKSIKKNF